MKLIYIVECLKIKNQMYFSFSSMHQMNAKWMGKNSMLVESFDLGHGFKYWLVSLYIGNIVSNFEVTGTIVIYTICRYGAKIDRKNIADIDNMYTKNHCFKYRPIGNIMSGFETISVDIFNIDEQY